MKPNVHCFFFFTLYVWIIIKTGEANENVCIYPSDWMSINASSLFFNNSKKKNLKAV